MSALGEYIHLHYSRYKKYGITRMNPAGSGVPDYSIDAINNRIGNKIKPISDDVIATLERRLKINSGTEEDKQLKKIQPKKQSAINAIYQVLFERSKNVDGIRRVGTMAQGGTVWFSQKKNDGVVNRYSKDLGNASWATNLDYKDLIAKSYHANELYKQINQLIDKINSTTDANTEADLLQLVSLFEQYTHITMMPNENVKAQIEEAIKLYRYGGAITDISGRFGEMLVAICNDSCSDLAEQTADEAVRAAAIKSINQGVVGDISSAANFNKKLVSTGYKIFGTNSDNQNQYSIGTTKNKVDVQIKVNDEQVFANVKTRANLDGKAGRDQLQDVDPYTALVFLNSQVEGLENFGNHWISMHLAYGEENGRIYNEPKQADLDEIFKKEVAYEALSIGNPFKTGVNAANVFVHINRATGKVYVKSVQQLLDNLNKADNRIGGLQKISTLRYNNIKQPEVWQRLNDILNQVHATKLSVAINIKYD